MSIEIKPGKWRMRNGECAVVEFKSTCPGHEYWHGYIEGKPVRKAWQDDGACLDLFGGGCSPFDLAEPWTEKPVVNWAAMPAWAKWVAMDEDGIWNWFAKKPDIIPSNGGDWFLLEVVMAGRGPIPRKHAPSFTGNWRDSLVERPSE